MNGESDRKSEQFFVSASYYQYDDNDDDDDDDGDDYYCYGYSSNLNSYSLMSKFIN